MNLSAYKYNISGVSKVRAVGHIRPAGTFFPGPQLESSDSLHCQFLLKLSRVAGTVLHTSACPTRCLTSARTYCTSWVPPLCYHQCPLWLCFCLQRAYVTTGRCNRTALKLDTDASGTYICQKQKGSLQVFVPMDIN